MKKLLKRIIIILGFVFIFLSFQNSETIPNHIPSSVHDLIIQKNNLIQKKEWLKALSTLNSILEFNDFEDIEVEINFYQEGQQIIENIPQNSIEIARFYQVQGDFWISLDSIDKAISTLKLAESQYITNEKKSQELTSLQVDILVSLAVAYYYQDNGVLMLNKLTEAETINKTKEIFSISQMEMYQLLGVYFYHYEEDFEKGIEYTLKALQINQTTGDDLYGIANLHNNLGVLYNKLQEFTQSAFHYQKTLDLYEILGEDNTEKIDVLHNYSSTLRNLGHIEECKILLFKALSYNQLEEDLKYKAKYELLLNNELAFIYTENNQLDSASIFIERASKIVLSSTNNSDLSKTLRVKAQLLLKKEMYNDVIKVIGKILTLSSPDINDNIQNINTYHILGQAYFKQNQLDKAIQAFDKAFQINTKDNPLKTSTLKRGYNSSNSKGWLETLTLKANTLKAINTPQSIQQAFDLYQEAIAYAENMRQNFNFEASKAILNAKTSELYANTIQIAHQLYQNTNDKKYIDVAFEIAEKQKGTVLLESFIDKKGKASYGVPNELIKRETFFKNRIAYYRQQMIEYEEDEKKLTTFKSYFNDYNLKLAQLKDTLKTFYSDYFNIEYQAAIATINEVQQQILQPNQALVEYITTNDSVIYVLAIEKNHQHFIKLAYTAKEKAMLSQLSENLSHPNLSRKNAQKSFKQFTSSAFSVYNDLFQPIKKELTSDVNHFVIVRAGQLSTIPFEALLTQPVNSSTIDFLNLPYSINDYQFHYGYSASLLLKNIEQQQKLKSNNNCLAFAPVYDPIEDKTRSVAMASRGNITPLIGTANEVKAISNYFGGQFDITNQATETKFKKHVQDYGILHLAMHGQPDINQPDYAHLIFANSSFTSEDDGLLYQYEIANLETNAQLAVLSACQTGVGKDIEGEGVMSLGRAFMYAGVPSIVMSLWKMNDISTSEIMPIFYQNLADKAPKDKALHQAKLAYLNQTTPERAHPFYWAGFIAIGDTAPIRGGSSSSWYWLIAISVALIGGFIFLKKRL